jgi:hypothetical protein
VWHGAENPQGLLRENGCHGQAGALSPPSLQLRGHRWNDFVWITPEKRDVKEHEAVWTNPKPRNAKKDNAEPKLRFPKHIERWVPIEDVCAVAWRQYQNALAVAG